MNSLALDFWTFGPFWRGSKSMDPKALGLLPKIRSASLQTTSKKTTWQRCQIQDGFVVRDGLLLEHVSGLYYSVTQLLYILFSSTNPCFEDGWTKKQHDSFNSTADHSLATPNPGDFLKDWMLLIFHTPENWRLEPEILATNRKGKNHRFLWAPVQTAGFRVSSILIFEVTWLIGGWTNPFEKYARQIGFIFPKFRGENKKYTP